MASSGRGQFLGVLSEDLSCEDLLPRPDLIDSSAPGVANDWFWSGAPRVTVIPYTWLSQPVRFRPDPPTNVANVTRSGGTTRRATNSTSTSEYGEFGKDVTLQANVEAEAASLAAHLAANFTAPRVRCPTLTIDLLQRANQWELWPVLDRVEGDRIAISGAPTTWPEGATSLVIEGIHHVIGLDVRQVVWNTSPIVGSAVGVPGPWFRSGVSASNGTDSMPF